MAKTDSTVTPTVIPLDPALNTWVNGLVDHSRHLYDSEEEARGVAIAVGFEIRRAQREEASGVTYEPRERDPAMEFVFSWMSAASPELRAEFTALMETTVKAGGTIKEVDAWMRANDPRSVRSVT